MKKAFKMMAAVLLTGRFRAFSRGRANRKARRQKPDV